MSASDLGRRLRHRREELGLCVEETAARAGVNAAYLDYLETAASPNPSRGTLVHLSVALQTSPAALLGGDSAPPGRGEGQAALLVDLDEQRAMELIAPGGIGRVVFAETRGPVALPVNYRLLGTDVVFRTQASTSIALGTDGRRVSFEVDHVDETFSTGWSVLLSGTARRVVDPEELEAVRALDVVPWAGGDRDVYFRLQPDLITGRQLQAPE